jgi:hypothetical protein
MAIPAFWNTAFRYLELQAVTDVNTIIAGINAELTALGWIDQGGAGTGPWKSPARADGVFFRIATARVSATRLSWTVYDQNGMVVTINAANYLQDIDAGGCNVQIYSGTMHFCVNSQRATQEAFYAWVFDQSPDSLLYPRPMYGCSTGPRTSDGTLRNYNWASQNCMMPNEAQYYARSSYAVLRGTSTYYPQRTLAGTALFHPAEFCNYNLGSGTFFGRIPMAITIDITGLAAGSEVTVPIDAGVNAVFKVVAPPGYGQQFLAFRKS